MSAPVGPPHCLLVRLPRPLGDAVLAVPALRALRAALPRTRIVWAGGPAALAALEGLPWRDGVMPVAGRFDRGWGAAWRAGRLWRTARPDAVLLLTHSLRSALAARFSGARVRVGSPREGRAVLLTHRVVLPEQDGRLAPRPMTAMYLDLVRPFGASDDGLGPEVRASPFDRRRAARRLEGLPGEGPLVLANPGAAFAPTKVYPPERLGAALRLVLDAQPGARGLVVCGPGEEELARRTAAAAGVDSTADDPPDLGELKGLLARARLLLSTDAGPRHLAEALGVPTVAILGPTDPAWTADRPGRVVRREGLSCLGCHLEACPIGHRCMEELEPEAVAAAAAEALRGPAARVDSAP